MNQFKLSTVIFITIFYMGTAHAEEGYFWDYFNNIGNNKYGIAASQLSTFDDSAHVNTYFWGYFNKGLDQESKVKTVTSFDNSKFRDTYFWGEYNK